MPSPNVEDYLERIAELIERDGYARAVEIATSLGVSKSSVTKMVQRLDGQGYVKYERYRGIVLTRRGAHLSALIRRRHGVLARFFRLLEVEKGTLENDVEGMEHHLSPETLDRIGALAEYLENHPASLRAFMRYHAEHPDHLGSERQSPRKRRAVTK